MIHKFSVSNYQSIREEAVLDLRGPGIAPDLPRFWQSAARLDVRPPSVSPRRTPAARPRGCAAQDARGLRRDTRLYPKYRAAMRRYRTLGFGPSL